MGQGGTESSSSGPAAVRGSRRGSDYADLVRLARARGLLDRQPGFYAYRIALNLGLYALGLALLPRLDGTLPLALDAVLLAFVFGQASFFGHDAAHGQISASRRRNEWLALFNFSLLLGLSVTWWRDHHDPHHVHPNDLRHDPDLRVGPLAFAPEQATAKRGILRWVTKFQSALFYPLLLLEGFHIRYRSIVVLARSNSPQARIEALLIAVHLLVFHGYVLAVLGLADGLAFLVLQLALTGLYVGSVFAPNHTGMPVIHDGRRVDALQRQVITARNVAGNALVDFCWGGLNYQIEHHLFPRLARNKLAETRRLVKPFCASKGIPYHETSVIRSVVEVVQGLHRASAPLRASGRRAE